MSKTHTLKILLITVLILSVLICFNRCNQVSDYLIDNNSKKINYNNIYTYAHPMFWIDYNTIYYAKSGLYNNTFYYADENGKHKITSDLSFNLFDEIGLNGEFHDIQAYGDNIYMLYQNEDGIKSFYLFSKESKTHKKLFTPKDNINEWAVVDNILIFSTFLGNGEIDVNSLWLYRIDKDTLEPISNETTAFGIANNQIRYIERNADGKNELYSFDADSKTSELICLFDYHNQIYNDYNFTEDYLVFFKNGLSVLNLKNGDIKNYQLPGYAKFMSCYENFAFVAFETSVYRINLTNGESQVIVEDLQECNLIYALNNEQAVIVCYENSDSLLMSVKVYKISVDGKMAKLMMI